MADETTLETRVTDAAAACAEEIAADEGWEDASDLTLTKLVIARHMRELLGVADPSLQRSDAIPHLDLSQQEMADEVCVPPGAESPPAADLAELAAKRIATQAARITALESIGPLLDDFQAACAAAGRFGDSEYRYDVRQLRARINALLAGSHAQEQTADAPC